VCVSCTISAVVRCTESGIVKFILNFSLTTVRPQVSQTSITCLRAIISNDERGEPKKIQTQRLKLIIARVVASVVIASVAVEDINWVEGRSRSSLNGSRMSRFGFTNAECDWRSKRRALCFWSFVDQMVISCQHPACIHARIIVVAACCCCELHLLS
jgi:hypothetical protein